jgi:hypothetical protein
MTHGEVAALLKHLVKHVKHLEHDRATVVRWNKMQGVIVASDKACEVRTFAVSGDAVYDTIGCAAVQLCCCNDDRVRCVLAACNRVSRMHRKTHVHRNLHVGHGT